MKHARDTIRRHLARFTPGFWAWGSAALALALLTAVLLGKIFFAGHDLAFAAVESGQRVLIHIDSAEVEGNPRHTRRETAAAPESVAANLSPPSSQEGLAPAPFAPITQQSDKGLLPVAARDGTLPWRYYARPYVAPAVRRPIVAVALTNLGLSRPLTEEALGLPHGVTLSFSPYAADAKAWVRKSRGAGFEALVDLPMEPKDYPLADPGPYGLLTELNADENSARLHWVLSRFPGFVGVLAPADEKMTADPGALRTTLLELAARGVLFVYVKTPANAGIADLAKSRGLYTLGADAVIDTDLSADAIAKSLSDLTALAKTQGVAVGIGHSYPPTLEALARWADSLAAQGVDLVPISAAAKGLP